jgi:ribosomal protein S18 acetylase RimI-like enzyme
MKAAIKKLSRGFSVRDARLEDLSQIICIVNSKNNRASFGWIPKVVLADAGNHQRDDGSASKHRIRVVFRARDNEVVAWTRIYHRNDGVSSLHELGVSEDCQSSGIGSFLVHETINACRQRGMTVLRLKTPTTMRSNSYYPRFGFKLVGMEIGRKRALNVYELSLAA